MSYFGSSWPVFLCLTVALMGLAAFMTGRALADGWRPFWHAYFYCLLLGGADRFLVFALFGGELTSLPGYLLDSLVLFGVCSASYRITRVHRLVTQYPWLYERNGLFGFRSKVETAETQKSL